METAQRVTKAVRFGIDEIQKDQPSTNGERVVYEFNDLFAVMELLKEMGAIDDIVKPEMVAAKKEKIRKYMQYSKELGVIGE